MGKKSQSKPEPQVLLLTLSSGVVSVLPQESMEDLEQLCGELDEEFEPDTPAEQFLVDQMVHARWKLIRVRRLESQAFANLVGYEGGSDTDIIRTLKVPGNIFARLDRMAAAEDRAYSKAVRELAQLRANAEKRNEANDDDDDDDGAVLPPEAAESENEPSAGPVQNEPNFEAPPPEDSAPRL